jgi:hypothetical protein
MKHMKCLCPFSTRQVFDNPHLRMDDEVFQEAVGASVYRLVGHALAADAVLKSLEHSRLDG